MLEYYSNFYATSIPESLNKRHTCIIIQTNKRKLFWDMYITTCLLFSTLVVPVRLAFCEDDPLEWVIVYALIDVSFTIDIILTFFTSFTNHITNLEVVSHK